MTDVVLTDIADGVLTVTLNRPDDNNRMLVYNFSTKYCYSKKFY